MAGQVLIRWKINAQETARHRELLDTVYEELASVRPGIARYDTYQLDDKVTFLSLVEMEGPHQLQGLQAFQRYRAVLDAMCEEPPQVTVLQDVGTYAGP